MRRAALSIAVAMSLAAIGGAIHLVGGPDPFTPASGAVLGTGVIMFAVIDVAGLTLSRGRWARRLGLTLAAAIVLVAVATTPSTPAGIVAGAAAVIALIGLRGRWLDGWIRRRPSADGPGEKATALVFALLALVPAVALASPADVSLWHGVLGAAGVLLAWGYAQAEVWALWATRTSLVPLAVPALLRTPAWGVVFLGALVGAITVVAWSAEARLAVQPLMDELPGPRIHGERGRT